MSSGPGARRRRLALAAALALAVVLAADAGVTSEYRRKLEATVEMPLDADVFRVPPGYNAPQQVAAAKSPSFFFLPLCYYLFFFLLLLLLLGWLLSGKEKIESFLTGTGRDDDDDDDEWFLANAGAHHAGQPGRDGDDGVVGDAQRARQQHGHVRRRAGEAGPPGARHAHALRLLQLHLRLHPPLHPQEPQAWQEVLLRHGVRPHGEDLLVHHAAQAGAGCALQVRPHRGPRADVRLQPHAVPLRVQRRRRRAVRRRPLLRRQPPAPRQQPVGHVGALRGAQRRLPAVGLDGGEPRAGLRAGAGRDDAVQALHAPLPDAVPRRGQHGALLVLGEGGLGARRRARLLLGVRQVHAAVGVAAGRAEARGQGGDAVARRADALAVVQQQRLPLHGGGDDAGAVRAVARRRQGRPRARRPRPRLRAQPPRVQRRLRHRQRQVDAGEGPWRAGVRDHRRRRQHRGHRRQLHAPAAELLGVPGGQLRARHAGDQEPDARLLRLAPEPGRRQGRRRRALAHQQVLDAHRRRRHQLKKIDDQPVPGSAAMIP